MTCNCNNMQTENVIRFVAGTTVNLHFNFDEDISTYTVAKFVIRADYTSAPIINKTVSISDAYTLDIELTPDETENFTNFDNGKNSATYIWGLDVLDTTENIQINVFPKTGNPAPLCVVYKHVI
ncbi:MAG: hypothetical protein J6S67_20860 [Methanobrevibacter sp.]|nr:hypothetical protein [Methanobrevibacter sp.]